MMIDYTPTTEDVREAYSGGRGGEYHAVTGPEFDRWLAAHDAEVAAIAWDAAVEETHGLGWLHDFAKSDSLARNPYRTDGA